MTPLLIYDVGVHNGDDTAYYLHKGFGVVGVEANPEAVAHLRRRFAAPLESSALQLLGVGVAEASGRHRLLCLQRAARMEFVQPGEGLERLEATARAIKVQTVTFRSILERYGVPYYCKIDIEMKRRPLS